MASGPDTAGKILSGCSCLSIVVFLVLGIFIQFGLDAAYNAAPDLAELWALLGGPVGLLFNGCCCLSGVGFIIGIALILLGKKKRAGAEQH